MYEVDDLDEVVELHDVPPSDVGVPRPRLISNEGHLVLAYLVNPVGGWDGSETWCGGRDGQGHVIAMGQFRWTYAHMFGPPNDEAIEGHPLAARGLTWYSAYEIRHSSWIRGLERRNSVHSNHDKDLFLSRWRHFVFTFHDSTFECIADRYSFELQRGSLQSMAPRMVEVLQRKPEG